MSIERSITDLAFEAIDEDLMEKYSTPEEVLEFLEDEDHFKSLSDILKETMINAGICSKEDTLSVFTKELYCRLSKQDIECGNKARSDVTVKRWLSGYTKSIRHRYDAIEICFALNLNFDLSKSFLNKCGYNSFNVRNAEDATYLYCIINGRTLSAAKKIISEYYAYSSKTTNSSEMKTVEHSGNTTLILNRSFGKKTAWKDDDDFLHSFLIPNRDKFIGFSITSLLTYYNLKNYLYVTVLINGVEIEQETLNSGFKSKSDIPISLALRSALRKYNEYVLSLFDSSCNNYSSTDNTSLFQSIKRVINDPESKKLFSNLFSDILDEGIVHKDVSLLSSIKTVLNQYDSSTITYLCKTNKALNDDLENSLTILVSIRDTLLNTQSLASQKQFSAFMSDIIKIEGLLKRVIVSIIDAGNERIRRYTGSSGSTLQESVMKEFPDDHSFANYEKDPSIIDKGMTIRKAIVLMYFFSYAYEFSIALSSKGSDVSSKKFKKMGFDEFIDDLNEILKNCNLPPLYYANQFDWLILRCIRGIENGDDIDDERSPLDFFNKVLAISFGDDPDEYI